MLTFKLKQTDIHWETNTWKAPQHHTEDWMKSKIQKFCSRSLWNRMEILKMKDAKKNWLYATQEKETRRSIDSTAVCIWYMDNKWDKNKEKGTIFFRLGWSWGLSKFLNHKKELNRFLSRREVFQKDEMLRSKVLRLHTRLLFKAR